MVDTSKWFGRHVLVVPERHWTGRPTRYRKLSRHSVKHAPQLAPAVHLVSVREHGEFAVAEGEPPSARLARRCATDGRTMDTVNNLITDRSRAEPTGGDKAKVVTPSVVEWFAES